MQQDIHKNWMVHIKQGRYTRNWRRAMQTSNKYVAISYYGVIKYS